MARSRSCRFLIDSGESSDAGFLYHSSEIRFIPMQDLRFAILGTARIAEKVAPHIAASNGVTLQGIASRSLSKAQDFAAKFDIPTTYSSYEEALDDPQIDAVYLPLPPSLHAEWTAKAAAAGKHILCEKPLAVSATEASQMKEVCRKHEVVLLDGVMWYHTARASKIHEIVRSGQLGQLTQLTSVFTFRWDEMPMDNIRLDRNMGGGALLDLGWYCVGAALWLFDEMPHKVQAFAEYHNDVDTRMNAFLWFPEQKVATIECSFDTVRRRWLEVAGSRQVIECQDFTRPWNNDSPEYVLYDNDGQTGRHRVSHPPLEQCMIEAFRKLVINRQFDHPWIDLSIQTQTICDALDQSARSGQAVKI